MRKLIIILLGITLALGACSTARQKLTPQGNVDFKTAQVYYSQQNVEKAEEYYVRVLADNPDHALSMRRMADINLHKAENNPSEAVQYNKKAYELYDAALKIYESWDQPSSDEISDIRDMTKRRQSAWVRIFTAGERAHTDGNTLQAKEIFEIAHALDESRNEPIIRLKNIYQDDLDEPARTEELLLQLVEKEPENLSFLLETGAFYFNNENLPQAVVYFERARAVAPADIDNLLNLSYAYYELDNFAKAMEVTQLALNLEPNNIDIIDNAKNIAYQNEDYALAVQYLEQLIEQRYLEEDFTLITYLLNELEDYDKLITYAKKWHDWDDTNKFAVQYIIFAAQKTGDATMQKVYQDILKTMP